MNKAADYSYIAATILLTVYGQIILKWRIPSLGALPTDTFEKIKFLVLTLFDPFIISGLFAAVLASLAWIAAMTKFELGYAYPFMSLNFVIVLLLGNVLFNEQLSILKIVGVSLIVFGTVVAARG